MGCARTPAAGVRRSRIVHNQSDAFVVRALLVRLTKKEAAIKRVRQIEGFTLIELLTVCAIIGVLAAIAIPQFVQYRQHAYDGMAQGDLRNAISAEEAHYSSFESYIPCADAVTCQTTLRGYVRSDSGISLAFDASTNEFTGTASHSMGSGGIWRFDSSGGRIVFKQ